MLQLLLQRNIMQDAIDTMNNLLATPICEITGYKNKVKVYQALLKEGLPKSLALKIIGPLKVEIPEVEEKDQKKVEQVIVLFARLIVKIYNQVLEDFGDDQPFLGVANSFELVLN